MAQNDGTTTCHRYCTAYGVSNGKPMTLATTYVRSDETEADAVGRVLKLVDSYPFEIARLLADSGFYNERIIRQARDSAPTVVQVPKKGDRMTTYECARYRPGTEGSAGGCSLLSER